MLPATKYGSIAQLHFSVAPLLQDNDGLTLHSSTLHTSEKYNNTIDYIILMKRQVIPNVYQ